MAGLRPRSLPHTVTVVLPTLSTDVYGATVKTYGTTGSAVPAFVQPQKSEESNDRVLTVVKVFTNEDIPIVARVIWDSATYEVTSRLVWEAADGVVHHYEATLQEVTG